MRDKVTWRAARPQALPSSLRAWLTGTGSLTRQMQAACQASFSVDLLHSGYGMPLIDEAKVLSQSASCLMYQREVHLCDGNKPEIYARTLVPINTYRRMRMRFDGLGSRSLGEMLFKDPTIHRSTIEVAALRPQHTLFELATAEIADTPEEVWARRSCFFIEGQPILVNEIFLPSDKWNKRS
jgi:chorismate--pyruvate lyase